MKFLLFVLIIFITLKGEAYGSYANFSQNFKTLCIRWSPDDKHDWIDSSNSDNKNLVNKISKTKYPTSGIYQFDFKFLWEVKSEFLANEFRNCRPLDDGHYVIFFRDDSFDLLKDGGLIKRLSIENFCKNRNDESFRDLQYSGRIDEAKKEFEFKVCGKFYLVDIASGKISEPMNYDFLFKSALLLFMIVEFVGMWKMFEKGKYPGPFCLIPFYNVYVMVMIAGMNPWILLFSLLPVGNVLLPFYIHYKIARKFQFGFIGSVFLAAFFWIIFYPIIGFGKAVYEDSVV